MASSDTVGQPPVDDFGQNDATWRPSSAHDPIQIAALHLQHQLITAARRAWPHVHPGADLTGSAFAEILGTPHSIRPAEKRLAGKQPLQLNDIVRLALYLGDDFLAALPRQVADLFPEAYRPLLGSWRPGQGSLPTFRSQDPGGHNWAVAIASLSRHLDEEAAAGRDHLLTTGAVVHACVCALNECGTDPSTIELGDHHERDDAVSTLSIGPAANTTLASVAYLPDRAGQPRDLAERLGGILRNAANHEADHRVLILVVGPAASRQLRTHLPDALDSHLNTQFIHRFQTLIRTPMPGDVPNDLEVTVLAREEHRPKGAVIAMLLTKQR